MFEIVIIKITWRFTWEKVRYSMTVLHDQMFFLPVSVGLSESQRNCQSSICSPSMRLTRQSGHLCIRLKKKDTCQSLRLISVLWDLRIGNVPNLCLSTSLSYLAVSSLVGLMLNISKSPRPLSIPHSKSNMAIIYYHDQVSCRVRIC